MKNILIPTDFSECANAAVDYALIIAKKSNAKISFIHTLYTPIEWANLPIEKERLYPEMKAQIVTTKSELDLLVKKVQNEGLKSRHLLIYEKGLEELKTHIQQSDYDLIIMGSHGTKGFKEIIGSNTQRVMRYSDTPILVVRTKPTKSEIKQIVFATDFEKYADNSLKKLTTFAKSLNAKIHLLCVNTPTPNSFIESDIMQSKIQEFLNRNKIKSTPYTIYNSANVETGILKFADSLNADIIALCSHNESGFFSLFKTSVTENIINESEIPVLSMKINTKP
jgi:nucleotide-binding universal stress UspA family protein